MNSNIDPSKTELGFEISIPFTKQMSMFLSKPACFFAALSIDILAHTLVYRLISARNSELSLKKFGASNAILLSTACSS